MPARGYQIDLDDAIEDKWARGDRNVLAVLPTGGGKTYTFSRILHRHVQEPSIAIAHRKELVGQISLALGSQGVHHRIIGPDSLIRFVIQRQKLKLGETFYRPHAQCAVASVNTLVTKSTRAALASWLPQVRLWVMDEAHHVLENNLWGRAVGLFPNARGLGVTATPCRADGKGLGRHAHGVMDSMVEGPTMRWLIENGYLCDYDVACPISDMKVKPEEVGSSGDYSRLQLRRAAKESHIVGDVVKTYLQLAKGKRSLLFAPDLETAAEMLTGFRNAGVRAEMLDGGTQDAVRAAIGDKFERGEFDVLINVDLFGEGYDVPAVECVIMARPTESYGLYAQQFGRALRILEGKLRALIIDHVGNIERHGLPDKARVWSLDARERTPRMVSAIDDVPLRYCPACTKPNERFRTHCQFCGVEFIPDARGGPQFVEGDLALLSPEALAELRGEIAKVQESAASVVQKMLHAGAPRVAAMGAGKNIDARAQAQRVLTEIMAWWMTKYSAQGLSKRECQKLFWHLHNIDVLSAQTLGRPEALALAERIVEDFHR